MAEKKYIIMREGETRSFQTLNHSRNPFEGFWNTTWGYRIIALRDIVDKDGKILVHKGEKGGFVESEHNLSQEGTCWIYDNAWVYGQAQVYDSAQVRGNVEVCHSAEVFGNAVVCDSAKISSRAKIYGDAKVYGNAVVCSDTEVYGHAQVKDDTRNYSSRKITGEDEAE